jgi:UDP-N-acetylmuramyl pentapeptide phosphotransferase/UDP-N-acetylglucosamine-1-phosphate transferase
LNKKIKNYDCPGPNKIHQMKVLTSGGIIPFSILSLFIVFISNSNFFTLNTNEYFINVPKLWVAPTAILILSLLSFWDSISFIPYQIRLFAQFIIVFISLSLFPINPSFNFQTPLFSGILPVKIDVVISIFFWIFIINSTNFMDGYDGMFSFQTISVFSTFAAVFFLINENYYLYISLLSGIISIIFIYFNFNKKYKMFIGDSGSIPAGFIIGWLTITLINMGYFFSAILINLIFILDVSFTLLIRIINKKSIFLRHNDFFFKKIISRYGAKKYFSYTSAAQFVISLFSILLISD